VRVGDAALAACRPSIGIDRRRREYYTVWEQFDPDNVDPVTGLARASVWAARSTDRGLHWGPALRLTPPGDRSLRFPYLAEDVADTLLVICFADSVAGFSEQGQGPASTNPVLCLRVAANSLPVAVAENPTAPAQPVPGPTIRQVDDFRSLGSSPVYDALGRKLSTARPSSGVYFVRSGTLVRRVLVLP
jgi:hypothetical protein